MGLFGPPNVYTMKTRGDVSGLIKALAYRKDESKGPVPFVWERARDALVQLKAVDPLIEALGDPRYHVRERSLEALGKIGDARAIDSLISALRDPVGLVRRSAIGALAAIGSPAVEPLIVALKDSDGVAIDAAEALAAIGDVRAVEPLIVALESPCDSLRSRAAWALSLLEVDRAVEPLLAALRDNNAEVRIYAAGALGKIGDVRAVELLITALKDSHTTVRGSAADALGRIGDVRAIEPLITTLKDTEYGVRVQAAEALGMLGDLRAVRPLRAALSDGERAVRVACSRALHDIQRAHPEAQVIEPEIKAEPVPQQDGGRPKPGSIEPAYRGGLGEPYCSQQCYNRAAQYAMLEIPGAKCGVCGKPASSRSGERDYAIIPYEGKTLVVCAACVPGMRARLRSYTKCSMCQKPF